MRDHGGKRKENITKGHKTRTYDESRISINGGRPFAICHTVHPSDQMSLSRPEIGINIVMGED